MSALPNLCFPCRGDGEVKGQTCPYCRGLGRSSASTWDGTDEEPVPVAPCEPACARYYDSDRECTCGASQ